MRSRTIAGVMLLGAGVLAACGGGGSGSSPAAAPGADPTTTTAVKASDSSLGAILVNADGRTLYGFTNDTNGESSCTGPCAQMWPPLEVSPGWTAGSGVGSASFHTIKRDDGHLQLAVGKWPLYVFSGDSTPGDVNGQGLLGKWYAVQSNGMLRKGAAPSMTPTTSTPVTYGSGY
jgi:predicted lipoprotein with Yx(FWY)xxD motif